MNSTALNHYLAPFQPFFALAGVSEISINRPGEIWVEQHGRFKSYELPILTIDYLRQFAGLVAEYNKREISPEYPTLSSTLPNGLRVQFVIEPACERGSFVCSIRQKSVADVSLADYFLQTKNQAIESSIQASDRKQDQRELVSLDKQLLTLHREGNHEAFLTLAVQAKKNIIISGGTSTGKTTLLNALIPHIPLNERLITVETDREVRCAHLNVVHLLAAEEGKSLSHVNMLGLLKAALRLRPDRILVSELRAEEAFPYLRAVNSGHPGSITTLHADSPEGCFDQLAFMVIQGGSHLSRHELITYAKSIVDIVVQIKRTEHGQRYVSEIYFKEACNSSPLVQPIREMKQVAN